MARDLKDRVYKLLCLSETIIIIIIIIINGPIPLARNETKRNETKRIKTKRDGRSEGWDGRSLRGGPRASSRSGSGSGGAGVLLAVPHLAW